MNIARQSRLVSDNTDRSHSSNVTSRTVEAAGR